MRLTLKVVAMVALASSLAGCGAPSCEDAIAKAAKHVDELNDRAALANAVGVCVKEDWSSELRKCVADVQRTADLIGCMDRDEKSGRASYVKRSKATEAGEQLNAIGKVQKRYYGDNSSYTQGKSAFLPSTGSRTTGCCGQHGGTELNPGSSINNKCTAVPSKFKADPVWSAMGFSVGEESAYAYSYESNSPTSFTAYAIGDTDCDGVAATFTLKGTIDGAGNPSVTLTRPPEGVY